MICIVVIVQVRVCIWVFWCFSAATDASVDYLTGFYNRADFGSSFNAAPTIDMVLYSGELIGSNAEAQRRLTQVWSMTQQKFMPQKRYPSYLNVSSHYTL